MLQPVLRPVAVAAADRLRGGRPLALPAPPIPDLDFIGRPSLAYPGLAAITFTRASQATYRDASGARQVAAADVARFDHDKFGNRLGLLIEGARTNFLLNSTAPASQTTGSLNTGSYTLWVEGSGSAAVAANSATIAGAGTATAGSPVTFTVTGAGTVDVTVTGMATAFQLEDGAWATSLIITAGATATRAADVANITTLTPWFNATEGTLFGEIDVIAVGAAVGGTSPMSFNDGTDQAVLNLRHLASGNKGAKMVEGGVQRFQINAGVAYTAHIAGRIAFGYKVGEHTASADGAAVVTNSYSGALPAVTRLTLGAALGGSENQFHGHLRRIAYWPRRLPNDTLRALSVL